MRLQDVQFLQKLRRALSPETVLLVQVADLPRQLSDVAAQLVVPTGNASSRSESTHHNEKPPMPLI